MHLLILKSFLIIIVIGHITCDKLNKDDNSERLENCGKQDIPIDKGKTVNNVTELEHSCSYWLVKVRTEKGKVETPSSTGFFISKRHILTSSQAILTMEKPPRWGYNGETIHDDYFSEIKNTVPKEAVDRMKVILGEDCDDPSSCTVEPASAYLIAMEKRKGDFDKLGVMLLIELKDNRDDISYPCLSNAFATYSEDEELITLSFDHKTKKKEVLEHRSVIVKEHQPEIQHRWIKTQSYKAMDDRGAPLVKVINGKITVIGLISNSGPLPQNVYKYFFDLGGYEKEICSISGVCPEKQATNAEKTTTTSASTSEATDTTSGNDSTTPPATSRTSQKPVSSQNGTTEEANRSIDEYVVADGDITINQFISETHIYALYLVVLILNNTKGWKLTPEENNKRLEECGRKLNSRPTNHAANEAVVENSHNDWIVKIQGIKGKHQLHPTTGSFISPRHLITSVQSVITGNREWGYNGKKFLSNCTHLSSDFEIPKEVVDHILIVRGKCGKKKCDQSFIRAERAFVLDFCEHEHFDRMFRIMIVEVKNYRTDNFACVADETQKLKKGETVDIYGFDGESLVYRLRQISNVHHDYLLTSKYYVKGDRGGPMIKSVNGRATIIGIGASTGFNDNSGETYFFKLSNRFHSFCDLVGVCKWKKLPPKPSSSSTTETTRPTTTSSLISSKSLRINSSKTSKTIQTSTENPVIYSSTECQFVKEEDGEEELDDGTSDGDDFMKKNTRNSVLFGVYMLTCFYLFT